MGGTWSLRRRRSHSPARRRTPRRSRTRRSSRRSRSRPRCRSERRRRAGQELWIAHAALAVGRAGAALVVLARAAAVPAVHVGLAAVLDAVVAAWSLA